MMQPTIEQVAAAVRAALAVNPPRPFAQSTLDSKRDDYRNRMRTPVFAGRLLSLKSLESLDPAMPTLALTPGTVVTPLAREALKRRGVNLTWAAAPSQRSGEWGLAIESNGVRTALITSRLAADHWQPIGSDAADWLVRSSGRSAVLLTDEASVAVYEANRIEGIRAAAPTTADSVVRAVARLNANLLALEPAAHHPNELIALCNAFRRGPR